jgi:hypothetical protein
MMFMMKRVPRMRTDSPDFLDDRRTLENHLLKGFAIVSALAQIRTLKFKLDLGRGKCQEYIDFTCSPE